MAVCIRSIVATVCAAGNCTYQVRGASLVTPLQRVIVEQKTRVIISHVRSLLKEGVGVSRECSPGPREIDLSHDVFDFQQ